MEKDLHELHVYVVYMERCEEVNHEWQAIQSEYMYASCMYICGCNSIKIIEP